MSVAPHELSVARNLTESRKPLGRATRSPEAMFTPREPNAAPFSLGGRRSEQTHRTQRAENVNGTRHTALASRSHRFHSSSRASTPSGEAPKR
jgi:hypothetical protein